jgi:hypothetical protein
LLFFITKIFLKLFAPVIW